MKVLSGARWTLTNLNRILDVFLYFDKLLEVPFSYNLRHRPKDCLHMVEKRFTGNEWVRFIGKE